MLKFFFIFMVSSFISEASEVRVIFKDLENDRGTLPYLVFKGEKGYPDRPDESFLKGEAEPNKDLILELPDGKYSLTVIHDENKNGKLDKNFVGMPKEGFGFSNNPRIYFGPPSYEDTEFEVRGPTSLTIKMKHL